MNKKYMLLILAVGCLLSEFGALALGPARRATIQRRMEYFSKQASLTISEVAEYESMVAELNADPSESALAAKYKRITPAIRKKVLIDSSSKVKEPVLITNKVLIEHRDKILTTLDSIAEELKVFTNKELKAKLYDIVTYKNGIQTKENLISDIRSLQVILGSIVNDKKIKNNDSNKIFAEFAISSLNVLSELNDTAKVSALGTFNELKSLKNRFNLLHQAAVILESIDIKLLSKLRNIKIRLYGLVNNRIEWLKTVDSSIAKQNVPEVRLTRILQAVYNGQLEVTQSLNAALDKKDPGTIKKAYNWMKDFVSKSTTFDVYNGLRLPRAHLAILLDEFNNDNDKNTNQYLKLIDALGSALGSIESTMSNLHRKTKEHDILAATSFFAARYSAGRFRHPGVALHFNDEKAPQPKYKTDVDGFKKGDNKIAEHYTTEEKARVDEYNNKRRTLSDSLIKIDFQLSKNISLLYDLAEDRLKLSKKDQDKVAQGLIGLLASGQSQFTKNFNTLKNVKSKADLEKKNSRSASLSDRTIITNVIQDLRDSSDDILIIAGAIKDALNTKQRKIAGETLKITFVAPGFLEQTKKIINWASFGYLARGNHDGVTILYDKDDKPIVVNEQMTNKEKEEFDKKKFKTITRKQAMEAYGVSYKEFIPESAAFRLSDTVMDKQLAQKVSDIAQLALDFTKHIVYEHANKKDYKQFIVFEIKNVKTDIINLRLNQEITKSYVEALTEFDKVFLKKVGKNEKQDLVEVVEE